MAKAHAAVEQRMEEAKTRLRRHQDAIEAGVNPVALVDLISAAQVEYDAARAELASARRPM